jgi:hypothetical protein
VPNDVRVGYDVQLQHRSYVSAVFPMFGSSAALTALETQASNCT